MNIRRWTSTAIDCYERGCVCRGCPMRNLIESQKKCQMKYAVIELVRKFGRPQNKSPDEG